MDERPSMSALRHVAALGIGAADAREAVARTLDAIRACDDPAIFTRLTPERAMAEASAAARRLQEGRPASLLDGVPIAWKDLFDIAGMPTTAGSPLLETAPPAPQDAPVVARLAAAGMICVGRTNMTEFAYSGIGLNPHFGTPGNARDGRRVPGGSSSGSAVAVARGLVPVAIGSDTGGSVRIPAAFNGVVGYKSSGGRYPMDGVFPLSRTLDTLGVFAHGVADAVAVDAAMRGLIAPIIMRGTLAGRRILVPTNVVCDNVELAVADNAEASLARLADAGAELVPVHLDAFDAILDLTAKHGTIAAAEAYALLRAHVEGPEVARMDQRVATRVRGGARIAMVDYVTLMQQRRRLIVDFVAAHPPGTLIAFPTTAITAPSIAALEADTELFTRINMLTLRNTMLGNILDWCGVSLPNGADAAGLPTALLLSGLPGADDDLLSVALAAEPVVRP